MALVLMGCSPLTKDSYMRKFERFTKEVSYDCNKYDSKDWEKMSRRYDKLSGKWYEKFRDELSMKELLLVRSYQARWYYYRGSSILNDVVEVEQLIRFYVDNDMQSDLQRVCEEAHRIGGETERTVNGILKKLNVSVDY